MKKWIQLLVFCSGFTPSVFCQISFLENPNFTKNTEGGKNSTGLTNFAQN